jgi:hypothetical protein
MELFVPLNMRRRSCHQGVELVRAGAGRGKWWVSLLLLCLVQASSTRCTAETGTQREYELKAALLYRIIEYVEWPAQSASNETSAITIGVIGQIPFAQALDVLEGKTVQGRRLTVKRFTRPEEASSCQVLFIGASEKARFPEIVAEVKNRPVLTVSEAEGFAERGGMVNLVAGPNHIVMEINREVANEAKLTLSSQLLKHAKVVTR